jgi:predicted amidophosphoribosyltransferase
MSNVCIKCGKEIPDEHQICYYCQGIHEFECPKCGFSSNNGEDFVTYGGGDYECKNCYERRYEA